MAKVVVVGGGYGGITVASGLDEYADVTLVEQKDSFVHHAAALRAAVDPVWEQTIFMPYSRLLEKGKIVHGACLGVEGKRVFVAGHEPIDADYIVLATGTTYPYPAKFSISNSSVVKARMQATRSDLAKVRRVMLVGCGTVGVEFAGELKAAFPHLEIVMVDREPYILGNSGYVQELRDNITKQLQAMGVELVLGSGLAYTPSTDVGVLGTFRVETRAGEIIEADMWFRCYGAQTSSGYLFKGYGDVMRPNGRVRVDEYLRLQGKEGIYAVGDITDVPESKRADAARAHARVVVANIRRELRGETPDTVYSPGKEWVILPLGPNGGASQLVNEDGSSKIVGPEETAQIKGNDLMVNMIRGQLRLP